MLPMAKGLRCKYMRCESLRVGPTPVNMHLYTTTGNRGVTSSRCKATKLWICGKKKKKGLFVEDNNVHIVTELTPPIHKSRSKI